MKSRRDNCALTSGALSIGTTPARARTNAVVNFNIKGRTLQKAVTDDLFLPAGTALAVHQVCAFFLMLDTAGVASVIQSAIKAAATNPVGYVAGAFEWPEDFDTKICIGAALIRSGAAVFTPGTTSLATVATYFNVTDDLGVPIGY